VTPSPIQLIIVLVIVLLLFGAKKIPELAKGLGTGMREFKQGASGEIGDDKKNDDEAESSTDKEAANAPASDNSQDGRSGDESSNESSDETSGASKTEQRS
jgi:sec-independent protein translocase protein TatA